MVARPIIYEQAQVKIIGHQAFIVFWQGGQKKMVMADRQKLHELHSQIGSALDNPLSNKDGMTLRKGDI